MAGSAEAIRRFLERAVAAGRFPGAVAARAGRDGTFEVVAAGRTAIGRGGRPVGPDTVWDLASLTKPLATATLALLAVQDGLLELASPVGRHLEEARGTWLDPVPVERLLTHTSGLPAWAPLYLLAPSPDRWLAPLLALGPAYEPGSAVVYSCPGYLLLGALLERLLGERLDVAFRRRIAGPLGLEDSIGYGLPPDASAAAGSAEPVAEREALERGGWGGGTPPPGNRPDDGNARYLGGVAGNAGLFGTVRAVVRLASEYLPDGPGTLLDPAIRRLAIRDRTAGLEQARALGWQLAATPGCSAGPALDPASFGHTGFTGTSVWADPVRGMVLALLSNRHHPVHRGIELHPVRRTFHRLAVMGEGRAASGSGAGPVTS